jgi:aryl-alcohol dehydrogenase-like predicted oxidoreductase
MESSEESGVKKVELVPGYRISPVIKGGWQLSAGHSLDRKIEDEGAIGDTITFIESGISTLDFGDIYVGVEELIGKALIRLKERHGEDSRKMIQLHTKYVPNEKSLSNFDVHDVRAIVNRSLARLGVEQVDLVQFHWWNYEALHYLEAMAELFALKEHGRISQVGITNFDLARTREFTEAGFKPASTQVQYSLLDRRVDGGLGEYCEKNGIGIIAFGTVAGGFISEKFLGKSEPEDFATRSNIKYKLIIDDFGGWDLFQELLQLLDSIAKNHATDIATISSAWSLQRPGVKAVIVGARNLDHLEKNLRIPNINFSGSELSAIDHLLAQSRGLEGDVYQLERYSNRHKRIIHSNNN